MRYSKKSRTKKTLTRYFLIVTGLTLLLSVVIISRQIQKSDSIERPQAAAWRSSLYPDNWTPGYKDSAGRFFQDFSFAGYHAGEKLIPQNPPGTVYDVTKSPYNADATGSTDTTNAIQSAINAAQNAGGGIVYLPTGTYKIKPQGSNAWALLISKNNVVLRGAGSGSTKLFLDATFMRSKSVIEISPPGTVSWQSPTTTAIPISRDIFEGTTVIPLSTTPSFSIGDWVILTHDDTAAWIDEHGMSTYWSNGAETPTFYRKVIAVSTTNKTITLDEPIRYYLKTRDRARVYKVGTHLSEVGIEHLSIGMRENTKSGLAEQDYDIQGTAAYDISYSKAINIRHSVNSWVSDVKSYRPSVNTTLDSWMNDYVHIQSSAIEVEQSRFITIVNCDFRNAEYRGGGGNGHFYQIEANDVLIDHSYGGNGRHNFSFKGAVTSGNVLHYTSSGKGWHMSDFHTKLSQANLVDNHTVNGDGIESRNRFANGSDGSRHGITNTQSVIWNTHGNGLYARRNLDGDIVDYIVHSDQHGWGYVIGTQGNFTKVYTPLVQQVQAPVDFVEGVGQGASLVPQSLYDDQLQRRLGRDSVTPTPTLAACQTNTVNTWKNGSFPTQSGSFTVSFDAIPNASSMNGVVGLSAILASQYPDLAAAIRFHLDNTIEVRNGSNYDDASTPISYIPGTWYHFRFVVNVPAKTYSVYTTTPGQTEKVLGQNVAFRTEQLSTSALSFWNIFSEVGTVSICNFSLVSGTTITSTKTPTSVPSITSNPTLVPLPGDANGDRKVDGIDFTIWLSHYGQQVSGSANGDFNNDGRVDGVDFVIWLSNYGQ